MESYVDEGNVRERLRSLTALATDAREIVLRQSRRANVGHIGSALSVIEILVALHFAVMRRSDPGAAERDRFIMSKGHAALTLYAMLHLAGVVSAEDLNSFCGDGTLLGVHPEQQLPGIDFSTGSLGHGLSVGVGCALAARLQGSPRRVFVLLSDAELNEGSVWEAAMFAAHHSLSNLCVVIDCDGQQAFGYTKDVLKTEPLADKWKAFGWTPVETPGHDLERLISGLGDDSGAQPRVIIARTVFGCGVSFMERQIKWHYLPMTDDEFEAAIGEVRRRHEAPIA
jgi:transketolase